MESGVRVHLLALVLSLSVSLLPLTQGAGTCAELLLVPSFGRLLLERSDFTQSQNAVNVSEGDAVVVECAEGYQLTDSRTNTTLSVSQFVTTCQGSGEWSVDISNLACLQQTVPPPPALSNFIIMIIVAAVLAVLSIFLLTTTIALAVMAHRLRKELQEATYVENEIAFARSQGAFTLSNPLVVGKDEESDTKTPKPLYLTPDEMTEFEQKHKI